MENLFVCAMDIGEQLMISGAEVHRVEESISRMCSAFGFARADVFIITTSMVVTVFDNDGKSLTQTRRINSTSIDYEKLHLLNDLSRRICENKIVYEEIRREIEAIKGKKSYPLWAEFLSYSGIAAVFTLFFGGGLKEAAVSLIIGALVRLGILLSEKVFTNKIFNKFISSLIVSLLAFVAVKFGVIATADNVIIGNIMTLIPGLGLTNALRDLFTGDSIAGLLRTIEAVLIALAIAAGYFVVALGGAAL